MAAHPADIIHFWRDAGPDRWFEKNRAFDDAIRLKFEPTHHAAARGEYDDWIETADGALALRHPARPVPAQPLPRLGHQFATDPLARKVAGEAIARGHDRAFDDDLRSLLLPALRPLRGHGRPGPRRRALPGRRPTRPATRSW